ncbi:MAG: ABC transporter substrate-binding protein, partial [Acidimicrobiia bacterium]
MTFSLIAAACGGDDDDEGSSGSDGGGEAGGGESEDEGGGVSGEPIKIGVTISLSGPAGTIGETQLAGIEMAVDELNEGDGILGRPVDLVVKDDASDPTKAAQNMRELVDQEEVKLVFGPTLSSPALAATPIASDAGVIQFSSSVAPELGDPSQYPYFFRVSPAAALQAVTFVEYIEASGWSKVGLLAVNNALGSSNVEAFKGAIAGTDIEIVSTETHESGAVDLTTQVSSLERSGAEVVLVLNTATSDQIAAVKARNGIEWDVPMLGFSSMSNPAVAAGVGGSMEGVYSGQQVRNLTVGNVPEQGERFLEGIREKLGQDP